MIHIGADVHTKNTTFCVKDQEGNVLDMQKLLNQEELIEEYLRQYGPEFQVGFEAVSNWGWFADTVERSGGEPRMGHPVYMQKGKPQGKKTDGLDADWMSELLRLNAWPDAYLAPMDNRIARELYRQHVVYSQTIVRLKNRISAVLHKTNRRKPWQDIFSKKGREWLRTLNVEPAYRKEIGSLLRAIEAIEDEQKFIEGIEPEGWLDEHDYALLRSMPGIGDFLGKFILAEAGDLRRYRSAAAYSAWCGLAPGVSRSDETVRRKKLRRGSRWMRWAYFIAATQAVKKRGRLNRQFLRISIKKGYFPAIMAVAREMAVITYCMLTTGQGYYEPLVVTGRRRLS
jgi:transposase